LQLNRYSHTLDLLLNLFSYSLPAKAEDRMDILHLVDRLEELFNESKALPFTRNVVVDEDKMLDLIDQMRVTIPEEVKKAQQVLAQRDRVLAQAQEEANRLITLAREKADQIVEREAIVRSSQSRADQILACNTWMQKSPD
jgi:hypothetical protein